MAALSVRDLDVTFSLNDGEVHAVRDLAFDVRAGETLAVVGESGSGKSQAFLAIMGLLARNGRATGTARLGGVDLLSLGRRDLDRVRGRDIAMIFQDPMTSLNPSLRVSTQLEEVLVKHKGLDWKEARKRSVAMLERVGIPEAGRRASAYPHELSGGMRQRAMIASALLCEPKVLVADEPTTALDVTVQAQILDLFRTLTADLGTALVLITHDMGIVAGIADRMMVMYCGRIVEAGPVDDLFYDPRHPYTLGLLQSTPRIVSGGGRGARLTPIAGSTPSLEHLPPGCSFHPRCPKAFDRCLTERPALSHREASRASACFLAEALPVTGGAS